MLSSRDQVVQLLLKGCSRVSFSHACAVFRFIFFILITIVQDHVWKYEQAMSFCRFEGYERVGREIWRLWSAQRSEWPPQLFQYPIIIPPLHACAVPGQSLSLGPWALWLRERISTSFRLGKLCQKLQAEGILHAYMIQLHVSLPCVNELAVLLIASGSAGDEVP